jgi:hypothetical protein
MKNAEDEFVYCDDFMLACKLYYNAPFNCKRLIIKPNDGLVWVLISINGLDLDAEILLLMSLENNFKRKKNTRINHTRNENLINVCSFSYVDGS